MNLTLDEESAVSLPEPQRDGTVSVEATMARRRSIRELGDAPLSLDELGQLLWSGQGVTARMGQRTAPSAGATYPLEVYVAVAAVDGLPAGMYRYLPARHALEPLTDGDPRPAIAEAAFGQEPLGVCPVTIVFAAVPGRTTERYGERGMRYVFMEVGHAAQNILLQATALGIGGAVLGAFNDQRLAAEAGLKPGEEPIYLIGLGHPV